MADDEEVIEVVQDQAAEGWTPVLGPVSIGLRQRFAEGSWGSLEAADRVIQEAVAIMSQCSPPTETAATRIGLVCGYVQSGKTASMTAITALARDNGYRIVILLAGVTTNLVDQNSQRLQTDLRAADSSRGGWLMLENPRSNRDRPAVEAVIKEWSSANYDEQDRRTLFVTVMKHYGHLSNLTALLSDLDLQGFSALVFDDEADQASLNTRPGEDEASATYRNILALRETMPSHTYLQYTATPQAPLLITRIDSLSADFVELVSPGEGYTGGETFFGGAARDLVVTIPAQEVFPDNALPLDPPDSLLRALQVFFVGVSGGLISPSGPHRSMLVHPSKAQAAHTKYHNWTTALKAEWHRLLLEPGDPERARLVAEFEVAHGDLLRTCPTLPDFDEILARLHVAINRTMVTLVNSADGHEVPWANSYSHILVGGEKLGRGYTVKGLTVTYMPRPPGGWTADTIQQRARFFGYHNDYLGYCRVYVHSDVRRAYVAYVSHEADMRARLAEHRGRSLQDWRRLFYLDRSLAPTRRNVLSSPYIRPRLPRGWFQPQAPHASPEDGQMNARVLRRLEAINFVPDEKFPRHRYAVAPLREVFEQILVPISYLNEHDALGLCVVNCTLTTLLERDAEARCCIYLMDHGQRPRVRRLNKKGVIPELFQGRSSAGAESYPGDQAFSDVASTTIQVHTLRIVEGETGIVLADTVPAVAIRLVQQEDVLIHEE